MYELLNVKERLIITLTLKDPRLEKFPGVLGVQGMA